MSIYFLGRGDLINRSDSRVWQASTVDEPDQELKDQDDDR